MQDLFAGLDCPARDAVPASDPNDALAIGCEHAWHGYLAMLEATRDAYVTYCATHGAAAIADTVYGDSAQRDRIDKCAKQLLEQLADHASQCYGVGGRLTIDRQALTKRFWPSEWDLRSRKRDPADFSPIAVWTHLKATYAATGQEAAYREWARILVRRLCLNAPNRRSEQGGLMVFECYFHSESVSSGGYKADYRYAHTEIPELVQSLGVFLAWHAQSPTPPADFAADVASLHAWLRGGAHYRSRERKALGPIVLQFFKHTFETRMPRALAERLNLFVTLYAADAFNDR